MRVVILALLVLSSPAFADEDPPEPVHEGVATALSLGGTVASWALVIGSTRLDSMDDEVVNAGVAIGLLGTFIAPSAGHWYSDKFMTKGFAMRIGGAASAGFGVMSIMSCVGEHSGCEPTFGGGLLLLGLGLYAGGTIYDIATAADRARERNAQIQRLTVAPLVVPNATGIALAGSF